MALIAVLVFAAVLWQAHAAWHRLQQMERDFSNSQSDSFHLAEHLVSKAVDLNAILLRFDSTHNRAELTDFTQAGDEFKCWIRQNKPSVHTHPQTDLLGQTQATVENYVIRSAAILKANQSQNGSAEMLVAPQVEADLKRILNLAEQLRLEEQKALASFLDGSHKTIGLLQINLLLTVILVFVLGVLSVDLVRLAKIAPLTAELGETRAVLERHEKLAALGTLAAGVAHEIRNPLTAMKLRLRSIERALSHESSGLEDAQVITQEIQRLERIVSDFLQFARPSAPRVQTVPVMQLFDQVRKLMGPQLEKAGIQLRIESKPELQVMADPNQIEQVLINLIQNAAESMSAGGSITLRAGTAQSTRGGAPQTVLEIVDTGKGITPEIAKRLFDPFFSTKEGGTGLGLSIAARIVEKHGGLLQYQTKVGEGTCFSVVLATPKGTGQ